MAETEGGLSEALIYTDVSLSDGPLPYCFKCSGCANKLQIVKNHMCI